MDLNTTQDDFKKCASFKVKKCSVTKRYSVRIKNRTVRKENTNISNTESANANKDGSSEIPEEMASSKDNLKVNCDEPTQCPMCFKSILLKDMNTHISTCIKQFEKSDQENFRTNIMCEICHIDLSHLSVQEREQHVNMCIDEEENKNKPKKENIISSTLYQCPFCGKNFETSLSRLSHIKPCTQKLKLDFNQVMAALQLHEKHQQERIEIGLPPFYSKSCHLSSNENNLKRRKEKVIRQPKSKNESDLQIALALSASLKEEEDKKKLYLGLTTELDSLSNPEVPVILQPPKIHQMPGNKGGQRKKKEGNRPMPVLLLRTEEERKRMIEERVAALVTPLESMTRSPEPLSLSDAETLEDCNEEKETDKRKMKRSSFHSRISTIAVKNSPLWSLASLLEDKKEAFYSSELKHVISPNKVPTGSKLRRLSQIPGYSVSQPPECHSPVMHNPHTKEFKTRSPEPPPLSDAETVEEYIVEKEINKKETERNSFHCRISASPVKEFYMSDQKQCSGITTLLKSLKSLVGNPWMSDVSVHVSDQKIIPAHQFLLKLRCAEMTEELGSFVENGISHMYWQDITQDAAQCFLKYLYTGSADLNMKVKDEVVNLASRYKVVELLQEVCRFLNGRNIYLAVDSTKCTEEDSGLQICEEMNSSIFNKNDGNVLNSLNCVDNDTIKTSLKTCSSLKDALKIPTSPLENEIHLEDQLHCDRPGNIDTDDSILSCVAELLEEEMPHLKENLNDCADSIAKHLGSVEHLGEMPELKENFKDCMANVSRHLGENKPFEEEMPNLKESFKDCSVNTRCLGKAKHFEEMPDLGEIFKDSTIKAKSLGNDEYDHIASDLLHVRIKENSISDNVEEKMQPLSQSSSDSLELELRDNLKSTFPDAINTSTEINHIEFSSNGKQVNSAERYDNEYLNSSPELFDNYTDKSSDFSNKSNVSHYSFSEYDRDNHEIRESCSSPSRTGCSSIEDEYLPYDLEDTPVKSYEWQDTNSCVKRQNTAKQKSSVLHLSYPFELDKCTDKSYSPSTIKDNCTNRNENSLKSYNCLSSDSSMTYNLNNDKEISHYSNLELERSSDSLDENTCNEKYIQNNMPVKVNYSCCDSENFKTPKCCDVLNKDNSNTWNTHSQKLESKLSDVELPTNSHTSYSHEVNIFDDNLFNSTSSNDHSSCKEKYFIKSYECKAPVSNTKNHQKAASSDISFLSSYPKSTCSNGININDKYPCVSLKRPVGSSGNSIVYDENTVRQKSLSVHLSPLKLQSSFPHEESVYIEDNVTMDDYISCEENPSAYFECSVMNNENQKQESLSSVSSYSSYPSKGNHASNTYCNNSYKVSVEHCERPDACSQIQSKKYFSSNLVAPLKLHISYREKNVSDIDACTVIDSNHSSNVLKSQTVSNKKNYRTLQEKSIYSKSFSQSYEKETLNLDHCDKNEDNGKIYSIKKSKFLDQTPITPPYSSDPEKGVCDEYSTLSTAALKKDASDTSLQSQKLLFSAEKIKSFENVYENSFASYHPVSSSTKKNYSLSQNKCSQKRKQCLKESSTSKKMKNEMTYSKTKSFSPANSRYNTRLSIKRSLTFDHENDNTNQSNNSSLPEVWEDFTDQGFTEGLGFQDDTDCVEYFTNTNEHSIIRNSPMKLDNCSSIPENYRINKNNSDFSQHSTETFPASKDHVTLTEEPNSFTDVPNYFTAKDCEKIYNSRPHKNEVNSKTISKMETKRKKYESPVTPLPNYHQMKTPELRVMLKKIGVKHLPRKRAVNLLTHIYEETHPWESDSEMEASIIQSDLNIKDCPYKMDVKPNDQKPNLKLKNKRNVADNQKSLITQKRLKNNVKKVQNKIDLEILPSQLSRQDHLVKESVFKGGTNADIQSTITSSQSKDGSDINSDLLSYISSDLPLYDKILLYEPLDLNDLHTEMKNSGLKVSRSNLIDFLDLECITFTGQGHKSLKDEI